MVDLGGSRANATLAAALPETADPETTYDNFRIRLRADTALLIWTLDGRLDAVDSAVPVVEEAAVKGLKFAELLPGTLAASTPAERLTDRRGAATVLAEGRISSS